MPKIKQPVQEQAKTDLEELLAEDAAEQAEVEQEELETLEYEPAEDEQHEEILPAPEIKKPVNLQKSNLDIAHSFLPQGKKTIVMGDLNPKNGIHTNPTLLTWPTDPWGLTKDLKSAFIHLASRIAGAEDKKALVDEVLRVGLGHLETKYKTDHAARKAAQAKSEGT